jgi:hypothetical protein
VLAAAELRPDDRSGFEGRHIEETGQRFVLLERLGRPGQPVYGQVEGLEAAVSLDGDAVWLLAELAEQQVADAEGWLDDRSLEPQQAAWWRAARERALRVLAAVG